MNVTKGILTSSRGEKWHISAFIVLIVWILWKKKYKSGYYLKGTKQINLSCPVYFRWYVGKTVLKAKQQIGKLLYIWKKKKNHVITGRVNLSLPQNSQLLYPVQWLMKNWYISFIIDLIFLRLPDLTWFVRESIRAGAYSAQHCSYSQSPNEKGFAWRQWAG